MRSSIAGAILAAALVIGLFAASHYLSHPAEKIAPPPSPSQIAAGIKPDFIGVRPIGAWKLTCGPGRELPKPPATDGHVSGNSEGIKPKQPPPPPRWRIPRCRTTIELHSARNTGEYVRLAFRQVGFTRMLALFLRLPPDAVQPGDITSMRLDDAEWEMPVRSCAMQFCLAVRPIKIADLSVIQSAKKLTLYFRSSSNPEGIAIGVPLTGLAESLRVIRKIDQ